MDQLLDSLCTSLDDEVERQENMLALCHAQGRAARVHDLPELQAKTMAIELLVREAAQAVSRQKAVFRQIADRLELPEEERTLSGLVQTAADPWRTRLRETQARLRRTLAAIHAAAVQNASAMRRSLTCVTQALESLSLSPEKPTIAYDAAGMNMRYAGRAPAVMDRRG